MLAAIGTEVTHGSCVQYCSWVGFDRVHYLCYTERPSPFDRIVEGEETGVADGSGDLGPGQEAV